MSQAQAQDPIIIIGAGFSGTLTAVHLLRLHPAVAVLLLDGQQPFGRGLAYRSADDNWLLNVPAGNMSAFADAPLDFVEYCQAIDPALNSASFVSRRIYGDYLEQVLAHAAQAAGAALQQIAATALSVRPATADAGWRVTLADGRCLSASRVVLALGHFPPRCPPALGESGARLISPWDFRALDACAAQRPLAIIGSGHTALDAVFRLTSSGQRREILMLSRRGLLSHAHRQSPQAPALDRGFPPYLDAQPATLRAYLHALRAEIARQRACGQDWRDVINALRAHTPEIWRRLPLAQKRKFLRRVAPYWDIHRHRLAPVAARRLQHLLASGQLEHHAATLLQLSASGDELCLRWRARADGAIHASRVAAVINCTGPNFDLDTLDSPLLAQLQAEGGVRQDALKLGLEVDPHYRVLRRDGSVNPGLYYLGPMLKARDWEAIAVPELRQHAFSLARQLVSSLTS
jgi:uncharacterized NAD(P)/FAD-binding protein YdhS